jgi:hypothetical protein
MSCFIYLDEFGDQIFISNRIMGGNGKNFYPEYYAVNSRTKEKLTPYTRSIKRARAMLKEYAKGDLFRKPLMRSKGWATCYGEKCLSCKSDICDGHVSMRIKRGLYA